MSRCLPFPPPNYMKNGMGGEALQQQLEFRRVKYCEEKKEEKKQKKNDKSEEEDDDKKSKRSSEKKRSNDDKESEKDDKSKTSHKKKKQRRNEKMETHLEYTKLTMNWFPLPADLDEEWLSRKNQSNGETECKSAVGTKHVGSSSSTDNGSWQGIQPLACYLPHADVYALPYALPF